MRFYGAKEGRVGVLQPCHLPRVKFKEKTPRDVYSHSFFIFLLSDDDITYQAQELPTSITQRLRLAKNPTQRVYILRTGLDSGEDQWLDQLEIGSPLMQESIRKSIVDRNGSMLSSSSSGINNYSNGTSRKTNSSPDLSPLSSSPTLSSQQEEESSQRKSPRTRSEEKGVYVAGMLKMGEKKLFIVVSYATLHMCVALFVFLSLVFDFYSLFRQDLHAFVCSMALDGAWEWWFSRYPQFLSYHPAMQFAHVACHAYNFSFSRGRKGPRAKKGTPLGHDKKERAGEQML